jgi:hypothetical protein
MRSDFSASIYQPISKHHGDYQLACFGPAIEEIAGQRTWSLAST